MTMVLALAPAEITFWQVILGIGAAVIVAVALLLGLLLRTVGSIAAGVQQLGDVAQEVAANTVNIKVALAVGGTLDEVVGEARRHAELLGVQAQ
jgi:HAMP domain-containing protein